MALCLRKNRESITKLNPYSSCCFCRGWWERVFYSFPPWWDDCSLLARKKFRYRRMTFVLKIVLPFLLPDYPLFEISGYSYVYTPNTPPSNSILILFHVINRSLSLFLFPSFFFISFSNQERQYPSRTLISFNNFCVSTFPLRREQVFQNSKHITILIPHRDYVKERFRARANNFHRDKYFPFVDDHCRKGRIIGFHPRVSLFPRYYALIDSQREESTDIGVT